MKRTKQWDSMHRFACPHVRDSPDICKDSKMVAPRFVSFHLFETGKEENNELRHSLH